jgi:hypothetical protein
LYLEYKNKPGVIASFLMLLMVEAGECDSSEETPSNRVGSRVEYYWCVFGVCNNRGEPRTESRLLRSLGNPSQ